MHARSLSLQESERCPTASSSQLFICVLHTLSRYHSQVVYLPQVSNVLIYGVVAFLYHGPSAGRGNVVSRSAGRAPVLLWCVLKGKGVCCLLVHLGHLSYFKTLNFAVHLLIPLLLLRLGVFCLPIGIHYCELGGRASACAFTFAAVST